MRLSSASAAQLTVTEVQLKFIVIVIASNIVQAQPYNCNN